MKRTLLPIAAAGLLAITLPVMAAGNPVEGPKASVRLLAAGVSAAGVLEGAIEITLPEGWHTYWRTPGDAGIAPVFDFEASRNLGPVTVEFPVPERFDDGMSISNIYDERVILPISAPVPDPQKTVELALKADLGACAEVCVPETAEAQLVVLPNVRDAAAAAALDEARSRLPGTPTPGAFAVESAVRDGGTDKRPVFRITAHVPSAADATVFVEGPGDWAPYAPELVTADGGKGVWLAKFSRLGAHTPLTGASLRVTIVNGTSAIEQTVPLDQQPPVR